MQLSFNLAQIKPWCISSEKKRKKNAYHYLSFFSCGQDTFAVAVPREGHKKMRLPKK